MPSITRRRLVGGAVAAAAAYGGHRLYRGRANATFASWTPADGTWPLRRFDPANTAHNPSATPPNDAPTSRRLTTASTTAKKPRFHPLVGDDTLVLHGSRLETHALDGELRDAHDATTPFAGLSPDGTLHAAQLNRDSPATLVGYAPDGNRIYRHSLPDDDPSGLTVGTREVYVGVESGDLVGIDVETGLRWRAEGAKPVLTDGRLYGASAPLDGTVAYAPRTGMDRYLHPGPARRWHTGTEGIPGFYHPPAVADGRLIHGSYAVRGGAVTAVDTETGAFLWEPRSLGADVATPALVGDRGFTAVGLGDRTRGRVVALDLTTGETAWSDETDWYPYAPAVGGDTLVVAGERRRDGESVGGVVRAYDTGSGDRLWTRELETEAGGLALVGDRILVTSGADLLELR
ncbi:Outer membrane protein assembly factor BamB, contains PQQ-like beta-propeller repeat [Haloplanus vescus]|uniref:Outer membrane protein assembly factor BamB, contains PQQ-like beta-propeller repeat n=1 Tax=Haloplanus vescus TaxID=555874 RepID=A0A1H3WE09_9EURY|nr:PQQ-binding-like beta-propeller repeat protein [Haloplanus vescus]SDZ85369.1 Outer membrane protein assembly factor BamB, contains PQQ-like beta-propeller repeat [Haloplanus vescus]